jgi:hypothetical protein
MGTFIEAFFDKVIFEWDLSDNRKTVYLNDTEKHFKKRKIISKI